MNLDKWFPPDKYNVHEISDTAEIANLLSSKGSTTWGQAPIEDSGYFQLAACSPRTKGDRSLVIVCKTDLIPKGAS